MIRVALCDDDLSVLNGINALIDQYREKCHQDIECTAFHSSLDLLAEIEKGICFDVLFLDVIMPGQNGINTAKEIRQYDNVVKIIFLTSSSEYAIQSYTVGAYFYQIKPICEENFFRLMDSAVSECRRNQQSSLILHCKSGITKIDIDKLEYCEVIGRTLLVHMDNGAVLESAGSMDKLCDQLTQYENFMRPHRSFLVNMEYIQSITSNAIKLESLAEIPIPHGKCSDIKNSYLEYAFNRQQVLEL